MQPDTSSFYSKWMLRCTHLKLLLCYNKSLCKWMTFAQVLISLCLGWYVHRVISLFGKSVPIHLHLFSINVLCLFKGATMVCFICSAAVNTLRAIQVLRRPVVVKCKLELLFVLEGVRLGDMERNWEEVEEDLKTNITVVHASNLPPTTSCTKVHWHFHLQCKTRRNLISISERWRYAGATL